MSTFLVHIDEWTFQMGAQNGCTFWTTRLFLKQRQYLLKLVT
jgi:hypothetical protein